MIASYLLDAGGRSHNLDDLAQKYLESHDDQDRRAHRQRQATRSGWTKCPSRKSPRTPPKTPTSRSACMPILRRHACTRWSSTELNETVEVPLIEVLADMEFTGIRIDPDAPRRAERTATANASPSWNKKSKNSPATRSTSARRSNSPRCCSRSSACRSSRKPRPARAPTPTCSSNWPTSHPLPAKIVEYRQYSKLKSTYVDALPTMIHPETGRVHTSFNQVVAATGRLSSSDPNLQNIPIRTEEGREIRSAFIAGEPGWKLLAADYSQIELRILAHYSQDASMCAAFDRDEDIHTLVASQVFGVPLDEVTSAQRRSAKAVNFGVIYGQSPFGLAKGLGISQEEAAKFIDGYFATYRGVAEFMVHTLDECRRQGYVTTILGRRRAIQGVRPIDQLTLLTDRPSRRPLNLPERTAVNSVIQGSAADMIKLAMLAIHRRLRNEKLAGQNAPPNPRRAGLRSARRRN